MEQTAWQAAQKAARFDAGRRYRDDTAPSTVFDLKKAATLQTSAGRSQAPLHPQQVEPGIELDWAGNVVRRPLRQRPQDSTGGVAGALGYGQTLGKGLVPQRDTHRHQSRRLFADRDLRQHSYGGGGKAAAKSSLPASPGSAALAKAVAQSGPGAHNSKHWVSSTQAMLEGKRHDELGLEPRRGRGRLNPTGDGARSSSAAPQSSVDRMMMMRRQREGGSMGVIAPQEEDLMARSRRQQRGARAGSGAVAGAPGLGLLPRSTSPLGLPGSRALPGAGTSASRVGMAGAQLLGTGRVAAHRDGLLLSVAEAVARAPEVERVRPPGGVGMLESAAGRMARRGDLDLGADAGSSAQRSQTVSGPGPRAQGVGTTATVGGRGSKDSSASKPPPPLAGYTGGLREGPRRLGMHEYFYRGR